MNLLQLCKRYFCLPINFCLKLGLFEFLKVNDRLQGPATNLRKFAQGKTTINGIPSPILQNQGKAKVLPVLPKTVLVLYSNKTF